MRSSSSRCTTICTGWIRKVSWPTIDTSGVLDQLARALMLGGIVLLVDHSAKAGSGNTVACPVCTASKKAAPSRTSSLTASRVAAKSDVLRRPDDARDLISYKGPRLGKTDRFVLVFRKAH